MKEREWRQLYETSQYDEEEEQQEAEQVPPEADPELRDEHGVVRRRARWVPMVYYVRRANSPSRSGEPGDH